MREITYKNLTNFDEIALRKSEVIVNRVMLMNAKKIIFEVIDSLLVRLNIVNDRNELLASLSVGSNERLLINEEWSYIERV